MIKLVNKIYERGWLNVEPIFEEAGWEVHYDKPSFNESGDARFEFKEK